MKQICKNCGLEYESPFEEHKMLKEQELEEQRRILREEHETKEEKVLKKYDKFEI